MISRLCIVCTYAALTVIMSSMRLLDSPIFCGTRLVVLVECKRFSRRLKEME